MSAARKMRADSSVLVSPLVKIAPKLLRELGSWAGGKYPTVRLEIVSEATGKPPRWIYTACDGHRMLRVEHEVIGADVELGSYEVRASGELDRIEAQDDPRNAHGARYWERQAIDYFRPRDDDPSSGIWSFDPKYLAALVSIEAALAEAHRFARPWPKDKRGRDHAKIRTHSDSCLRIEVRGSRDPTWITGGVPGILEVTAVIMPRGL